VISKTPLSSSYPEQTGDSSRLFVIKSHALILLLVVIGTPVVFVSSSCQLIWALLGGIHDLLKLGLTCLGRAYTRLVRTFSGYMKNGHVRARLWIGIYWRSLVTTLVLATYSKRKRGAEILRYIQKSPAASQMLRESTRKKP
jgi:hypothetical protein